MKQKKTKFFIMTGITTLLLILIVVFGVMMAYELPFKYDMTTQLLFTLSEDSVVLVENLEQDVRIGVVYQEGNEDAMMTALLDEYAVLSDKLTIEYLDAEKDPSVLASYNIGDVKAIANGTIIVNSGDRYKLIAQSDFFSSGETGNIFYGEGEVTGAIRFVTTEDLPKVYILQGHGEVTVGTNMLETVATLERNAYQVDTLSLLQEGGVPSDCDILYIPGPTMDIDEHELSLLEEYVDMGGDVLLTVDPILGSSEEILVNFNKLANKLGVDITNNYIFEQDTAHYMTTSNLYLMPFYGQHEVTLQLINEMKLVVLPLVRGLSAVEAEGVSAEAILQSSANSWARYDMTLQSTVQTEQDAQGPINIGYAVVKETEQPSRAIIIGDTDFALDGNLSLQANGDLFINSVNWLAGGRETEIISGKVINSNTMAIRADDFTTLMILTCVVIPLIMFVAAVVVWRIRKRG